MQKHIADNTLCKEIQFLDKFHWCTKQQYSLKASLKVYIEGLIAMLYEHKYYTYIINCVSIPMKNLITKPMNSENLKL